ncbi:hypothetical protein HJ590_02405 [Naumannella sp. ID2617S]|nr:hypothetical protein [Naumannella sp. ID2617S]
MNFLAGLSKGVVVSVSAAVIGSTAAITGAVLSGPADAVDNSSPSAYVRTVAPLAQANQTKYRVPASVSIAQSILESDWGKSGLTTRGNAYFGIKCSSNMGPYATGCLYLKTTEYDNGTYTTTAGFRTYKSAQDSFYDHGWFLTNNSRYAAAFRYPTDAKRFIAEVAKAGYATDPTYTKMIVDLMDRYNLYQYDRKGATQAPSTTKPAPSTTRPAPSTPAATPSRTATPSATATPSRTATPSATATPSRTATPSATATPSRTATPSATATPSRTATPRATATPTATPTASATPTATATPTASATPSLNPSAVRAEQPQDPMKAGAVKEAPRAAVAAPKASANRAESSGGLAKTGA